MAKTRAVYEPGELDRVRKNIGDLDPEEARRLAGLLGGEVGVEKDPLEVAEEKRRQKIAQAAEEARRAAIDSRKRERMREVEAAKKGQARSGGKGGGEITVRHLPFSARVRMDFRCSHPDHLIKTQSQALSSLFSFLPGYHDSINPYFISVLCSQAYEHIDKLVQALRFIIPSKRVELWAKLREFPQQYAIMEALVTWNLDGISGVMAILQGKPRDISLENLRTFLILIFKPLFRVKDVFEGSLFKTALATATAIAADADADNRKRYTQAREEAINEAEYIYANLFFRWYPLLMKFCAYSFHEYPDFYYNCRPALMKFLGLSDADIIRDPGPLPPTAKDLEKQTDADAEAKLKTDGDQSSADPATAADPAVAANPSLTGIPASDAEKNPLDEKAAATEAPDLRMADLPGPVQVGLDLMDKLFPESGWKQPDKWPDLYPRFSHLYSLPRGADLIAPTDPLIQIIVLSQALNDIFHGFRSMRFGLSQDGASVELNLAINDILNDWMLPVDDIIAKAYLPLLSEYCRLIETERESQNSAYAAKREADLVWYKRRYFLPLVKGSALAGIQTPRDKDIKAHFKQARQLKEYISMIALDIDRAIKARQESNLGGGPAASLSCVTIVNPFDTAEFEVENVVSRRLRMILKHEGEKPKRMTNATLIYYAFSILQVLDYLMNHPNSWANQEKRVLPYRVLKAEENQRRTIVEVDPEKSFLKQIDGFIRRKAKQAPQ